MQTTASHITPILLRLTSVENSWIWKNAASDDRLYLAKTINRTIKRILKMGSKTERRIQWHMCHMVWSSGSHAASQWPWQQPKHPDSTLAICTLKCCFYDVFHALCTPTQAIQKSVKWIHAKMQKMHLFFFFFITGIFLAVKMWQTVTQLKARSPLRETKLTPSLCLSFFPVLMFKP